MSERNAAGGEARALMEQLVGGYRLTQMVYVVAELGIADRLAVQGPMTAGELAEACAAHEPSLRRILEALVSVGVFTCSQERYGLNPAAELLRADLPGSLRPWAIDYGQPWWWGAWAQLLHTVRTGGTAFIAANGAAFFDYLRAHPADLARFNAHMSAMTAATAERVAAVCELREVRVVVDVAGGQGVLLRALLARHPALRGVLFDLPEVIAEAKAAQDALAGRMEFRGGSFFAGVPVGGDLYLLKDILHDWGDEQGIRILQGCRAAMGPAGRLVLIEMVLDPDQPVPAARLMDVSMLVLTGGRQRTAEDYRRLLEAAGLRLTKITPAGNAYSLIESRPA